MNVKMNTQTFYNRPLVIDDVVSVPDDVGARWVARGLADATDDAITVGSDISSDDQKSSTTNEDKSPYDGMKAKELFELCKERGIEAESRKTDTYYIDLLEASDIAGAIVTSESDDISSDKSTEE